MRATVRVGDLEATLEGWRWDGHEDLAKILNRYLDPNGPPGWDPAPELHEAQRVAALLNLEVVDYKVPPFDKGAIY